MRNRKREGWISRNRGEMIMDISWRERKFNPLDDFDNMSSLMRKNSHYKKPSICFLSNTKMAVYLLASLGVKRCKIQEIDCNNLSIFVSPKDRLKIDGVIDNHGIDGVKYNIHDLPFWECWFKKYKVERVENA
jgi:hypothetical protein